MSPSGLHFPLLRAKSPIKHILRHTGNMHAHAQMQLAATDARPARAHSQHTRTDTNRENPNWDAQQREELAGPPANLMHGDHFQNRTKWWTISLWQSGSPQGPQGGMACNCVRMTPE